LDGSEKYCFWEVGRCGCQNDGLDEADVIVREGGRANARLSLCVVVEGGREGGREGGECKYGLRLEN